MFPAWLHLVSILSLLIEGARALVIAADETRLPQQMAIKYLVCC